MTKRGSSEKHRPPSKIRYDKSHPVLGTRVSRGEYDEVKAFLERTGMSFANFISVALDKQVRKYNSAYNEGFRAAKVKYGVTFGCSVCGKWIYIKNQNSKAAAAEAMETAGWGHGECLQGQQ